MSKSDKVIYMENPKNRGENPRQDEGLCVLIPVKLCNIYGKNALLYIILVHIFFSIATLFLLSFPDPNFLIPLSMLSNILLLQYEECCQLYRDRYPNPIAYHIPYNSYHSTTLKEEERESRVCQGSGLKGGSTHHEGQQEREREELERWRGLHKYQSSGPSLLIGFSLMVVLGVYARPCLLYSSVMLMLLA